MVSISPLRNRRLPLVPPRLGVLSFHLDGTRCPVGCAFCYLGARTDGVPEGAALSPALLEATLLRLDYTEVAVAVSEPIAPARLPLATIVRTATMRGRKVALTTTAAVLEQAPELAAGVDRINVSVDPRKGTVRPQAVAALARRLHAPERELVLIVSLISPEFAAALISDGQGDPATGLLGEYLRIPEVSCVVLNGLKPPPPWCDRAFWLAACARLAPLLRRYLGTRLQLDCYVAARILGLGGCPARPDVSPGPVFRSCVYQAAPDFWFADAEELAARLAGFTAPAVCPFPIV